MGGYGFGQFYGGSGGIIVLDGGLQLQNVQLNVQGGISNQNTVDGCGNGGAGTIWFPQLEKLIVDNRNVQTSRITQLRSSRFNNIQDPLFKIANTLIFKGQAKANI